MSETKLINNSASGRRKDERKKFPIKLETMNKIHIYRGYRAAENSGKFTLEMAISECLEIGVERALVVHRRK